MGHNARIAALARQIIAHNQTSWHAIRMVGNQYYRANLGNVDQGTAFDIKAWSLAL